jgi:CheY-like chemotaxis protein/predicted regulator of Ras-like GTPase activity (Roadblock/LC7/MglB family)
VSNARILVVDDDPDLLFLVAHGVKSLQPDYQVTTAPDGAAGLQQAQKQTFDLIITDYMMPEMTGLELIQEVRQLAPETRFILMTAHHDSQRIRGKIDEKLLAGFVSKPFAMPELLETVQRAMAQIKSAPAVAPTEPALPKEPIQKILQSLRRQIGAQHVLLVNSAGTPLLSAGEMERARAFRLAGFVSASFLAIVELANLFGDHDSVFKSSYYEGSKYNVYAHDINGNFFLAVVFGVGGKPGTVWFYTRQAALAIASLLPATERKSRQVEDGTLATDFDELLGGGKSLEG